MKKRLLYMLSLLFAVDLLCFAQYVSAVESVKFQYLGVNEGLSQHDITCLMQDSAGYMWIATYDGLNRYDGKNIEVYRHKSLDDNTLSGNRIICLYEDSMDHIWIGTEGNGINCLSMATGKITRIEIPWNYRKVNAFVELPDHSLLVATSNGMLMIDRGDMTCKPILESPVYGLSVNDFAICGDNVFVLTESGVWLIGKDGHYMPLPELQPDSFIKASSEVEGETPGFYFATHDELFFWGGECIDKIEFKNPVIIRSLFYDADNHHLMVGTENRGIVVVEVKTGREIPGIRAGDKILRELFTDYVTSLYVDRQNILWVGTNDGVNYANLNAFPFYSFRGCLQEPVGFIYVGDNYLYASVRHLYSACYSTVPPYEEIESDLPEEIKKVIQYGDRKLLAAPSGIYMNSRPESHSFVPWNVVPEHRPELATGYTSVEKDEFDNIYFSTWDGLVIRRKDGKVDWADQLTDICKGLENIDIYTLKYDIEESCLWIGTATSGLFRLNLTESGEYASLKIYNIDGFGDNYIPSNSIWTVHVGSDSSIWIGTDAGLLRKTSGHEGFIQIADVNIVDKKILSIVESKDGALWMGSSNSMLKYSPETGQSESFRYKDGLLSSSFTEAADVSSDGKMYFGGAEGINWFVPEKIKRKNSLPEIILTGLYINGDEVVPDMKTLGNPVLDSVINMKSSLVLRHYQDDFGISFSLLPYNDFFENKVRYRLNGIDDDWIYVDNAYQLVSYKNLQAGTYNFEVEGVSSGGTPLVARRCLTIKVLPAPWFSWWAYLIYCLIGISVVCIVARQLVRQHKFRRKIELEKLKHYQEDQLNEMKLTFFTDITHEIKTPLSLISGPVADLIKMGPTDSQQRFCLSVIARNVKRMTYMVSQLLDFRKIMIGRYTLKVERGNLAALMHKMSEVFSWEAKNSKIDFRIEVPEQCDCWFDPDVIEKVLYNLLSNAFHYTLDDGVVSLKLMLNNDGYAEISVEDNGIGMSDDMKRHIFERFYHGSDTASSGIGLNLSYSLMQSHHGKIYIDETWHPGSRFVIRFPIDKSKYDSSELSHDRQDRRASYLWQDFKITETSVEMKEHSCNGKRILIVEDDIDLRLYLQNALKTRFRVDVARTGKEGLECAAKTNPDMIISDVMMPEMDGLEMLENLKADSSLSHIPVLLLTAKTDLRYQREGIKAGAFDYILKPFDSEVLFCKISNAVNHQEILKKAILKNMGIRDTGGNYTSNDIKFIEKLNSLIETRMSEPDFSVDNVAKEMAVSRMSLHRKVKVLFGVSITGYINIIRMRYVKNMFDSGCDRCQDAMVAIGIDSTSYFNKLFKEQYGMSPSIYINSRDVR